MLNGKTSTTFKRFKLKYYNSIGDIYGTHDWIADRAIIILYNHYPNDPIVNSIYNNQNHMRAYYLFGTELPDTMGIPSKPINIETDNGNILTRKDFYINHSVALREDGTMSKYHNENNLFRSARRIINNYTKNKDFKSDDQASAIFFGYICHLIGDACYIHHVYKKPNKSIEQQSKGEILKRTRNTPEDILWPYSPAITDIQLARNEFNKQTETLEKILLYCVWHTFYGKAHSDGAFQEYIIPNWLWYKDIFIKKIDKNREFDVYKKWWDGVIFHLNLAIFYTAVAINGLRFLYYSN